MIRKNITRRTLMGGIGMAAALVAMGGRAALAQAKRFTGRKLLVSCFGGATGDFIQQAAFTPFDAASGAQTTMVKLMSAAGLARMKAETGNPQIDLFVLTTGQEVTARQENLTQTLTQVTRLNEIPASMKDPDNQWVAFGVIGQGLVYRTDKFKTPPTSYKDLFKPEYKGHIAFPAITNGFGLDFLVMLAKTFGGGEDNIDPGFEAMKKLKAETIFKAASDLPTLFAQGDIWLAAYDTGTTFKMRETGLPVAFVTPSEGSVAAPVAALIAKGSKNEDVASAAIDRMLSPESQIELAKNMRWAPTNQNTKLPADIAAEVPSMSQLVQLDRVKMDAQRPSWVERWNREISR